MSPLSLMLLLACLIMLWLHCDTSSRLIRTVAEEDHDDACAENRRSDL